MTEEQIKALKSEQMTFRVLGILLIPFGFVFTLIIFPIFPLLMGVGLFSMTAGLIMLVRSFIHHKYNCLK